MKININNFEIESSSEIMDGWAMQNFCDQCGKLNKDFKKVVIELKIGGKIKQTWCTDCIKKKLRGRAG